MTPKGSSILYYVSAAGGGGFEICNKCERGGEGVLGDCKVNQLNIVSSAKTLVHPGTALPHPNIRSLGFQDH